MQQNLRERYSPPSLAHPMGTDGLGRDVFARVIWGTRPSLGIGIAAACLSTLVGALVGFLAGFTGGRLDTIVCRFTDMLMAFPMVLLAIIIVTVMGSGLLNLILAISVASLPSFIRVSRSAALSIREADFVMASNSIGSPKSWQLLHHVVPNGVPLVIVLATARMGTVILTEASLSFLGLGVPPGTPTWGAMIAEGRSVLVEAPWVSLAPGIAIMLVVLSFNQLGDGLRDILDPRMRGRGLQS
jgi:peptide/nickel transport system permease protein